MKYLVFIFLLLIPATSGAICPLLSADNPPLPPVLKNVSVNNETRSATITWDPSPSAGIAGYVVYRYRNNEGYAIDTIRNPSTLSFTDYSTGAFFFCESYVVAALDNEENISPLSNSLNTIFLTAITDTCNLRVNFGWNLYTPSGSAVTGYEIMAAEDEGDFVTLNTVSQSADNFIWNDFGFHHEYHLYIRAVMADGSSSVSNMISIETDLPRPPEWAEISLVTTNDTGTIVLTVEYDPLAETNLFNILRKTEEESDFSILEKVSSSGGSFTFPDHSADDRKKYIYRIDVLNNCNNTVISTLPAKNIVLENKMENSVITLSWNSYPGWSDGINGYALYRNTDGSYQKMAELTPADTVFYVDYRSLMYGITGSDLCFRVKAERYSIDNQEYEASSNSTCITTFEEVFVPTAFTPNDDGLNDFFSPVMPFTPSSFLLVIRDRSGRLIYTSTTFTDSWNGTLNGTRLPPDVYLWHLRLQTPSGKIIERRGSVAIIYNN